MSDKRFITMRLPTIDSSVCPRCSRNIQTWPSGLLRVHKGRQGSRCDGSRQFPVRMTTFHATKSMVVECWIRSKITNAQRFLQMGSSMVMVAGDSISRMWEPGEVDLQFREVATKKG